MIPLISKSLPLRVQQRLDDLQTQVDTKGSFLNMAKEAKRLWQNKSGNAGSKTAFEVVQKTLKEMCVSVEVCNYCEQNEANDIEHIYPKSFFPGFAFKWDNYLLACKQCNTGYKLDKCYVIDKEGGLFSVKRGEEPVAEKVALINPRVEDPNAFMILDLQTFRFMLMPGLAGEDQIKAEKTLEILALNNRDTLVHARKEAAKYFYLLLEKLIQIKAANSVEQLEEQLPPHEGILDRTLKLATLKEQFTQSIKHDIQSHQHPSVWHSIKTIESKVNKKWKAIFSQLPEALNW